MSGLDEIPPIPEDYPPCGCRESFFWSGDGREGECCFNPDIFLGSRGSWDKVFPSVVGRGVLDGIETIYCNSCKREATRKEFKQIMAVAYAIVDEQGRCHRINANNGARKKNKDQSGILFPSRTDLGRSQKFE